MCNECQLFQEGLKYQIIENEPNEMNSVIFHEETELPILEDELNPYEEKKSSADETCRTQQHILMYRINRILSYCFNMSMEYHVRRQKSKTLSKLTIDKFIDIDEKHDIIIKDRKESQEDYDKICEIMNSIFNYFLDNRIGLTNKLIIGDYVNYGEKLPEEDECIYMSRYVFDQIYHRVRFKNENVIDVIKSFSGNYHYLLPFQNQNVLTEKQKLPSLIQSMNMSENSLNQLN